MRSFLSFPLLAATAAAGHIKCNDADGLDTENSIALSNGCSDGKISDGDWFTVSCDVGSKKGTFGLHLNWCLANDDGGLSIWADGGAMNSCDASQCTVSVTKRGDATMECHADDCKGTIDLNKAINYTGDHLACGGHIGGGATDLKKRDPFDDNFGYRPRSKRDDSAKWNQFCDETNFNKQAWNDAKLGVELQLRSDEFYSEGPCGPGPYPGFEKYKNFVEALHDQTTGLDSYEGCYAGQCDGLEGVSNDICYSSDENPMWWMFIRAVKHYSDYINMLKDGVKFGGEYAKDNATNIVDHFSTQVDDSNSETTNALAITAGFLGAFGSVLPAGGYTTGAISGLFGLGNSIYTAATAGDNAKLVQDMLLRSDAMKTRLSEITGNLNSQLNEWGKELYQDKVWFPNDAYKDVWYSDQTRSLVNILKDGDFAAPPMDLLNEEVAYKYSIQALPGVLAFTWAQEKVFIIKMSSKLGGTKPCDVDWAGTFETTFTCIDDVAYVFHKTLTGSPKSVTKFPLDKPPGIDNLKDFGLPSQEDLIKAAIVSQDKGGYFYNWTDTIFTSWPDVDGTRVFNLPICEIAAEESKSSHSTDRQIVGQIGNCHYLKDQNGAEWPYDYEYTLYKY